MGSVVTPKFRVSYASVFKPRKNELNGNDEYSVVALFPKGADLSGLKAAANEAVSKKFGPDKTKWPTNLRNPFRDQAERAKNGILPTGYEAGAYYLNLKSSQRPGVVDSNVQPILDEAEFYSGCYAKASISAYAYSNKGNNGVSFSLVNLQKVGDGDTLGGRTRPEEDFKPIADLSPPKSEFAQDTDSLF